MRGRFSLPGNLTGWVTQKYKEVEGSQRGLPWRGWQIHDQDGLVIYIVFMYMYVYMWFIGHWFGVHNYYNNRTDAINQMNSTNSYTSIAVIYERIWK